MLNGMEVLLLMIASYNFLRERFMSKAKRAEKKREIDKNKGLNPASSLPTQDLSKSVPNLQAAAADQELSMSVPNLNHDEAIVDEDFSNTQDITKLSIMIPSRTATITSYSAEARVLTGPVQLSREKNKSLALPDSTPTPQEFNEQLPKAKTTEEASRTKNEDALNQFKKEVEDTLSSDHEKEFESMVLKTSADVLTHINIDTVIKKFPNSDFQNRIFGIILRKIETDENAENYNMFKSEVLLANAQALMTINSSEKQNQIKLDRAKKALNLLENANIIQNFKISETIEECTKTVITNYDGQAEAFDLAKFSIKCREENLKGQHSSTLKAYLTGAEAGIKINDKAIKIEALKFAELALNQAFYTGDFACASMALKYIANINKYFKDEHKSNILEKQAAFLDDKTTQNTDKSNVIMKIGLTDSNILAVKEKIQSSVLDPIFEAAARGYWTHCRIGIEYGVKGWINDNYLKTVLGHLNTEVNVKCALMLAFEAINLGIMSTSNKNPLCAVIFVQKYQEVVKEILVKHPEYFVDMHIFRSTITDEPIDEINSFYLDQYEQNMPAKGSINNYLESQMLPVIEARLKTNVLDPVAALIRAGKWDEVVKIELLKYASSEYLTIPGTMYTSVLGQNLSSADDGLNVARILIFRTIVEEIEKSGSKNFEPVEEFKKMYPDITARVLIMHPEYIHNHHIQDVCASSLLIAEFQSKAMFKDSGKESALVLDTLSKIIAGSSDSSSKGDNNDVPISGTVDENDLSTHI